MKVSSRKITSIVLGDEGDVATDPNLVVLTLASAMLTTGVVMISPVLSDLTGPFGVSEARVGLLIVAFTVPPLFIIPITGILADRFGRKRVMIPGLFLFAIGGGAVAFTSSFELALLLRGLQGVGFAAAMPVTVTLVGDLFAGSRETTAQGLRMAINYVFNIATPLAAGLLVALSWRWPFVLYTAMIPIAVLGWYLLPEVESESDRSTRGYLLSLVSILRWPAMSLVMVTFAVRFVLFYGYLTYVAVLGTQNIGVAAAVIGLAVSVKGALSVVSATQTGRLTAFTSPGIVVGGGFVLSGVGVALPGLIPTTSMLLLGSVLLGIGDAVYGTAQKSMVTQNTPVDLRAGAISAATLSQSVGKSAGPLAMGGILLLYGPAAAFVALGVLGVALGVGFLAFVRVASADSIVA